MAHGPEDILDTIADLVLEHGGFPTLAEVARASGLSKPGVLHHFPSRLAMAEALVAREVERVDQLLATAAAEGHVVDAWLALSRPSNTERGLYIARASVATEGAEGLGVQLAEATARWESFLGRELGDPDLALLVRVVGDGLLMNELAGTPVERRRLDPALARVLRS